MTISSPDVLLGAQQPRLLHLPDDIATTAGAEAIELAASAGLMLDPWQRFVLDASLGERPDDARPGEMRWSAREVAVLCTRQSGKGAIIEARELAGLVLFDEKLILHSAHEFKTANEAFLRIQSLIESCDDLRKKVLRVARANGEQGIFLRNGARLRFIARSKASGRGFSGDLVILDEAYDLDAGQVGALVPTLSARPNPQMWYLSSAPKATSEQLHRVRARAQAGESRDLAYFEWSADEDDDPADPATWAKANPALGGRIRLDTVAWEFESMPLAEFKRERLGIPDMPVEADGGRPFTIEQFTALADPRSVPVGPVAFVVDVSPGSRSACIALGGVRDDGRLHVEVVDHRDGVDWVMDRRRDLEGKFPDASWVLDPTGPAILLRSVASWREFGPKDGGEAFATLVSAVKDTDLAWKCPESAEDGLLMAVSGAKPQHYGDGAARWSRRHSAVDICPLVALTLASHAARTIPAGTDPLQAVW